MEGSNRIFASADRELTAEALQRNKNSIFLEDLIIHFKFSTNQLTMRKMQKL